MLSKIEFYNQPKQENIKFSILIPTWNNLPFVKLCVESIIKNSYHSNQIILHINDGSDGTLEWAKENNIAHSYSKDNVGVSFAFNAASVLAHSDLLVLIDDDNYVTPNWDKFLSDEIDKVGHNYFSISGTRMEVVTSNPCCIESNSYGSDVDSFQEEKFLAEYKDYKFHDWSGSCWYPLAVHKNIWNLVGGLSVEYTPGMGSDPDFGMKLWEVGVRYFKGLEQCRVYHFVSKTTGKVRKNDGRRQFAMKWFMNNSTFFKFYLKMGEKFPGTLSAPELTSRFKKKLFLDKLKRVKFSFKNDKF